MRGLTLIELLIAIIFVLVIIGIVVALYVGHHFLMKVW